MKREQEDVELAAPDNVRRCDGMSALMYAAHGGYPQCCMHLLAAKADPNGEDEARQLMQCLCNAYAMLMQCLRNVSRVEDGMRPLHFAAANGSLSVCELLLQPLTQFLFSSFIFILHIYHIYIYVCIQLHF